MASLSTGETYTYDANGNMITRVEGGLTYTQTFNAENQLISVAVSGQTTQFIYDGDGNLVKKINPNGSKTIYVGGVYEVDKASGGSIQRTVTYYPVAGAMRINSTLYYMLKDHLGSASVITNASGVTVSGGEQRYYPYGEGRLTATMITDKLFTGQREMAGLGIYHYGARFYSPKLGRFLSPDTIVPGAANPQAYNRYSYVLGNPLKYTDPSGHEPKYGCYNSTNGVCTNANGTSLSPGNGVKKPKKDKEWDGDCDSLHRQNCRPMPSGPDPFVSDFLVPTIEYVDEMIQTLINADQYEYFLKPVLRRGSLLARAINPFPWVDATLGFGTQALLDINRTNLSLEQKAKRAVVVGVESGVTGLASDFAGGLAFLGGEAVAPQGGGLIAAPLAAAVTSLAMDGILWNNVNQQYFEANGLGSFP